MGTVVLFVSTVEYFGSPRGLRMDGFVGFKVVTGGLDDFVGKSVLGTVSDCSRHIDGALLPSALFTAFLFFRDHSRSIFPLNGRFVIGSLGLSSLLGMLLSSIDIADTIDRSSLP